MIRVGRIDALNMDGVPSDLFTHFDAIDDHLLAALENYAGPYALFVADDDEEDDPVGVAVVISPGIVTGFVIDAALVEVEDDGQIVSEEKFLQAHAALLKAIKAAYRYLVVHDADDVSYWEGEEFLRVPPPVEEQTTCVAVMAWNIKPTEVWALLKQRGIAWSRDAHRYRKDSAAPRN